MKTFRVVDGEIQLRMDPPTPEILPLARQELEEEANRMRREEKRFLSTESTKTNPVHIDHHAPRLHIRAGQSNDDANRSWQT